MTLSKEEITSKIKVLIDATPPVEKAPQGPSPIYDDEIDVKVRALLAQLPSNRERRTVLHKVGRQIAKENSEKISELRASADLKRRMAAAGAVFLPIADEWKAWRERCEEFGAKLQRPSGSMLHKFCDALDVGYVLDPHAATFRPNKAQIAEWKELADAATVYVIEHDWAAAFEGATDIDAGEIRLPSDTCAFEFKINGVHEIAFALQTDDGISVQQAVHVADKWALGNVQSNALLPHSRHGSDPDGLLIAATIRAVCVALEAEVAATEVIRAPHKLNRARERRGQMPIYSYHVVNLARRQRSAKRLDADDAEPTSRKRLHFRRGHWRHFETFKTWVKWTLVGDPDLGFVDKHYKL